MRAREKKGDDCRLLYRADNVGFNSLALSPPILHGSERQTRLTGCLKQMKLLVLSSLCFFSTELPFFSSAFLSGIRKVAAGERLNTCLFVSVSSQQWPQGSRLT